MPNNSPQDPEFRQEDENLYASAKKAILSTNRASTSTLQRHLQIGYNQAARLMQMLEIRGIVGPENGSTPRLVLVKSE